MLTRKSSRPRAQPMGRRQRSWRSRESSRSCRRDTDQQQHTCRPLAWLLCLLATVRFQVVKALHCCSALLLCTAALHRCFVSIHSLGC